MDTTIIIAGGLILGSLLGLSWFAGTDAPYVATAKEKIINVLKAAGVKKGKTFYELGSGDGRLVLEAAKLEAESYGIEQSWIRVWYARLKARQLKLPNAHFYHGDLFDRQYFPADIVFIYLLPKAIAKLEDKLPAELKKGSIIITQTFHFKKLKPFKKVINKTKNDKIGGEFYLYKI
jgi:SAM-dependent methyltransferase